MRLDDDKSLLKGLRRQKPQALEAVILRYGGYVMAVALRVLGTAGSREDAEEVASDAFATLWHTAQRLHADSNLKGWLAVVSRNTALKRLRTLGRELPFDEQRLAEVKLFESSLTAFEDGLGFAEQDADDNTPEGGEDGAAGRTPFALAPAERELLERHYLDGTSLGELAKQTNTSLPAVKSRLYRSRKTLRKHLDKNLA